MKRKTRTKRRVKRRTTRRKTPRRRTVRKRKPKRLPFGGYAIDFSGREETLEDVFGWRPISPAQMTKRLWTFIKRRHLNN